jgi:hypothetical protein
MDFHPISYTKQHPVAVIVCVGLGYFLGHGGGMAAIPIVGGLGFKAGAKANVDDE